MTKRVTLWALGFVALVFTYLSAVNITETFYSVDPFTGAREYVRGCGGLWNPVKWLQYCPSSRPARLGVLAIGVAALITCGYFGEKGHQRGTQKDVELVGGHRVIRPAGSRITDPWTCENCDFKAYNRTEARAHRVATGGRSVVPPSPGMLPTRPSETGVGAVPALMTDALSTAHKPLAGSSTPEFKTCPDCAEQVRYAARKCRFCGYRFGEGDDAG
jgi:predicted RNA-binding Zn-ribbon protein involved in translation (DUF1610 family)